MARRGATWRVALSGPDHLLCLTYGLPSPLSSGLSFLARMVTQSPEGRPGQEDGIHRCVVHSTYS